MRISKCYYCSSSIHPGHGSMFVRNDGRTFSFCRSKCQSHFKARHSPRKSKWTKVHRKVAGKELANDRVFEFEQRRNVPVKYNRELYIKTLQAMKVIERIREKRKLRYHLMMKRQAQLRHSGSIQNVLQANRRLLKVAKAVNQKKQLKTPKQKVTIGFKAAVPAEQHML